MAHIFLYKNKHYNDKPDEVKKIKREIDEFVLSKLCLLHRDGEVKSMDEFDPQVFALMLSNYYSNRSGLYQNRTEEGKKKSKKYVIDELKEAGVLNE